MNILSPVRAHLSLNEQAYQAIKEAILNLTLKPGDNLVESELAQQLGMSKTPVRDALLQLEREGLVTKVLFKGTYVAQITHDDVKNIFEIRSVLEGLAARLAAAAIDTERFREVSELVDREEQAFTSGDARQAADYNRQFHEWIVEQSGNSMLKPILEKLDDQLKRVRIMLAYQKDRMNKSIAEHRQVLEGLRQGDPVASEKAMRYHLESVLADFNHKDYPEGEESPGN